MSRSQWLLRALLAAFAAAVCVLLAAPVAAQTRGPVVIVPLGEVAQAHIDAVSAAMKEAYGVEVQVLEKQRHPPSAWYAPRKRWRADKLLGASFAELTWPPEARNAWKVVLLTDAEISATKGDVKDWGIGGLGLIGGRACVVSSYIIRRSGGGDGAKTAERLGRLAVHELGHTLGLEHCGVFACVMRDARGKLLSMLDSSTGKLCGQCRKRLAQED